MEHATDFSEGAGKTNVRLRFGGFFVQIKSNPRVVNDAMLHGAITQLVSGLVLVGLMYARDLEPTNTKIAIKTVILLVIACRKKNPSAAIWGLIGALTVVNVIVAVRRTGVGVTAT